MDKAQRNDEADHADEDEGQIALPLRTHHRQRRPDQQQPGDDRDRRCRNGLARPARSEEHTSELKSLMRNSYAVICLKKKKLQTTIINNNQHRHKTHTANEYVL